MNTSQSLSSDQNMVIQLEIVSEDNPPADIADVDEVGRSLFDQLIQSGYTVKPASTGMKGGGALYDIFLGISQFLHDNKDWLIGSIIPVFECVVIACARRAEREKPMRPPFNITIVVNDKEADNPKDAEKLREPCQRMRHDTVKIKIRVPRKKRPPIK